MSSSIKPTVGMKVQVILLDNEDNVKGTITKVEPLILEETDEVLSEHFPTITLADGRIVNGMECWWYPVGGEKQSTFINRS
jgi:hypothetical protein